MKLFKIPRNSKINCEVSDGSTFVIFHRLDGAYSYCVSEKGEVCHLSANTDLEMVGDAYRIKEK